MGWRSVVVSQHAKMSYSSRNMIVQTMDGINQIPIEDIDLLLVSTTQAVITTALISELGYYYLCWVAPNMFDLIDLTSCVKIKQCALRGVSTFDPLYGHYISERNHSSIWRMIPFLLQIF